MRKAAKAALAAAGLAALALGMAGCLPPTEGRQGTFGGLAPSSYGYLRYRVINNRSAVEITGFGAVTASPPTEAGPVQIPSHIEDLPVIRIRERVFTKMDRRWRVGMGVTHACLPYTLTDIGAWAFYRNRLTAVAIPSGVTHIRRHAFERNNIRSLDIPDGVQYIGVRAFQRNDLGSVTIPDSVQYIGALAFRQNRITEVSLPRHTAIADNSFDRDVAITRRDSGIRHDDHAPAMQGIDGAARLDPDNARSYFCRGNEHYRRGALGLAIADFEAALRIDPNNAPAMNNLQIARQRRGRQANSAKRSGSQ